MATRTIRSVATHYRVVAVAGTGVEKHIIARFTLQRVISAAADQYIVASQANERVIAVESDEQVRRRRYL